MEILTKKMKVRIIIILTLVLLPLAGWTQRDDSSQMRHIVVHVTFMRIGEGTTYSFGCIAKDEPETTKEIDFDIGGIFTIIDSVSRRECIWDKEYKEHPFVKIESDYSHSINLPIDPSIERFDIHYSSIGSPAILITNLPTSVDTIHLGTIFTMDHVIMETDGMCVWKKFFGLIKKTEGYATTTVFNYIDRYRIGNQIVVYDTTCGRRLPYTIFGTLNDYDLSKRLSDIEYLLLDYKRMYP